MTISVCLKFVFLPECIGIRRRKEGREDITFFREADLNGRQGFFHFSGLQSKVERQFSGRGWHPAGHLGTFFFLKSVFIFCSLNTLVMLVVEAIFWKMWTFLSVRTQFKTKNWSWCLMNNNDVEAKYVEIKLSFDKFSVSPSTGAITIFV